MNRIALKHGYSVACYMDSLLQSARPSRSAKSKGVRRIRLAILTVVSLICCLLVYYNGIQLSTTQPAISSILELFGDLSAKEAGSALRAALGGQQPEGDTAKATSQ